MGKEFSTSAPIIILDYLIILDLYKLPRKHLILMALDSVQSDSSVVLKTSTSNLKKVFHSSMRLKILLSSQVDLMPMQAFSKLSLDLKILLSVMLLIMPPLLMACDFVRLKRQGIDILTLLILSNSSKQTKVQE
jgi:hypothetical protein